MSLSARPDDATRAITRQERWIETRAIAHARSALADALSVGSGAVLVTGPSGHGKTTLLRSFWHHPPRGFAPVPVPSSEVTPDQIAAQILAEARSGAVHDAAGALSRLLRTQKLRGVRPVLLVDDLDQMPPETLLRLLAIARGSRIEFGLVAAGSTGAALDARTALLPQPVRSIAIDEPWTRTDAERLIALIGEDLPAGDGDSLAAVDVDEALRGSDGNPRLVRAAIAAQVRCSDLLRPKMPAILPPAPAPHSKPTASPGMASLEPVELSAPIEPPTPAPALPEPVAPPELAFRDSRLVSSAPVEPPPPAAPEPDPPRELPFPAVATAADREPRVSLRARAAPRRPSSRALRVFSRALLATVALVLLVDRALPFAAQGAASARSYASDTAHRIAAWRAPEVTLAQLAGITEVTAMLASDRIHEVTAWGERTSAAIESAQIPERATAYVADRLQPLADLRALGDAWLARPTPARAVVTSEPPIRVAVNSDPWSDVEVDGVAVGPTPLVVELAPGPHHLRAEMADGRVREQHFDVAKDRNRVVVR